MSWDIILERYHCPYKVEGWIADHWTLICSFPGTRRRDKCIIENCPIKN